MDSQQALVEETPVDTSALENAMEVDDEVPVPNGICIDIVTTTNVNGDDLDLESEQVPVQEKEDKPELAEQNEDKTRKRKRSRSASRTSSVDEAELKEEGRGQVDEAELKEEGQGQVDEAELKEEGQVDDDSPRSPQASEKAPVAKRPRKKSSSSQNRNTCDSGQRDVDLWLSKIDGVLEMVNVYESLFTLNGLDESPEEASLLLRDNLFHRQQVVMKLSKVISEGDALILQNPGSDEFQEIGFRLDDLKNKLKTLESMARRRTIILRRSSNFKLFEQEISDLEKFIERSLRVGAVGGEHEETEIEIREKRKSLDMEILLREGRIEDIKRRARHQKLEYHVDIRIKTTEEQWAQLMRKVENDKRFEKFEKTCEESRDWFTNAKFIGRNTKYGDTFEETETLIQELKLVVAAGSKKMVVLDDLANNLAKEHSDSERIRRLAADVKSLCENFKELTDVRMKKLNITLEVHLFHQNAVDMVQLIEDYKNILKGRDEYEGWFATYPFLIGNLEKMGKRLVNRVEADIRVLSSEVRRLVGIFPELNDRLSLQEQDFKRALKELQDLCNERCNKLLEIKQLKPFFDEHDEQTTFLSFWIDKVNKIPLRGNVDDAKINVLTCQDFIDKIKKLRNVDELIEKGEIILEKTQSQFAKDILKDRMESLREKYNFFITTAEEKLRDLKENLQLNVQLDKLLERERKRLSVSTAL